MILTRANGGGLFNIAQESDFATSEDRLSPLNTEWAVVSVADGVNILTFDTWNNVNSGSNGGFVDRDMVIHLLTDDIYLDIIITEWTRGSGGGSGGLGGFAYERSTDPAVSNTEASPEKATVRVFPNPTTEYLQVDGLLNRTAFQITNALGAELSTGFMGDKESLNVSYLAKGM